MTTRRRFMQALPLVGAAATWAQRPSALPADLALESESDWKQVRLQFSLDADAAYFNAGGLGPAPVASIDVQCDTMRELQRTPAHGRAIIEEARPQAAEFLGAAPEEIAFTRNATEGNSTVASGLRLESGDEVLLDSHAHQGGSIVWMTRQKYEGIRVRAFDPYQADSETIVKRVATQITPRTKVIQVSHVTAPTGIRMPVKEIAALAAENGAWFHIDGAQSAGMIPVHLGDLGCDSYATSGHKWLCGPTGTGILYVRKDRLVDVQPTDVGSYGNTTWQVPDTLQLVDTARRFECGTRDAAIVAGLAESLRLLQSIGIQRIHARGTELANHLRERLAALPMATIISPHDCELRSSMVTFTWKNMTANQLFSHCHQHRCRCRPVREQGLSALRVSTHLFNSVAELDKLTKSLQELPV